MRIWTGDTYRVFYVARFPEAVYILHAFGKKTQKTSKKDIELGKKRYQQMMKLREDL
ncbi:type II toxin-antitoxin system RelE/ParE family toxin [Geminocystis herdmanii]|uniref:type II toxin-antitoxin system RelE/ParE family toxin n=1 Tax=Geminocystis herdmanii TaxID=669359 RepID=UPI0009FEE867|nr:type II toxin-antitoxin system RelE/ParE family toxin [Geminocystis herdmanii]